MAMPLEGRVAIVTGASSGIGKEIALHLAEKGAKVVVHYSSNQGTAEEVASTINNLASSGDGVRAIVCKADVAEPSQVAQLFDMALIEAMTKSSPFERVGKVEDVAPVVAFLASEEGEWVNAQVVRVNGGRV